MQHRDIIRRVGPDHTRGQRPVEELDVSVDAPAPHATRQDVTLVSITTPWVGSTARRCVRKPFDAELMQRLDRDYTRSRALIQRARIERAAHVDDPTRASSSLGNSTRTAPGDGSAATTAAATPRRPTLVRILRDEDRMYFAGALVWTWQLAFSRIRE